MFCLVRWLFGCLLSALAAVCGLTACTGGGHDEPASVASSTPLSRAGSTSSSVAPSRTGPLTTGPNVRPGEKPPVLSPIARQHSRAGAIEFAVYYIKALDWSQATSDPYLLVPISARSCVSCQANIRSLRQLAAEHGYLKSGRTKVLETRVLNADGDLKAEYVIKLRLQQEPVIVIRPTAVTTVASKPETLTSYVYVSWIEGRWLIAEREGAR